MPERISEVQFNEALPAYVYQAHELIDTVAARGIAEPQDPNVHVFGSDVKHAHYPLSELWEARDQIPWLYFDVYVKLGELGLGVRREHLRRTAWLYNPPAKEEKCETTWLDFFDAYNGLNLVSPVWSFVQAGKAPKITTVHKRKEVARAIEVGLYKEVTRSTSIMIGYSDVSEVTAETYRQARYPALKPADEAYLAQGVYTLHTRKIEHLLKLLGDAARPQ